MASKKRQQTINKRNRERAVEEKRTLKRQAKQEKREAARNGETLEPTPFGQDGERFEQDGEPELAVPAEPGAESVE